MPQPFSSTGSTYPPSSSYPATGPGYPTQPTNPPPSTSNSINSLVWKADSATSLIDPCIMLLGYPQYGQPSSFSGPANTGNYPLYPTTTASSTPSYNSSSNFNYPNNYQNPAAAAATAAGKFHALFYPFCCLFVLLKIWKPKSD